MPGQVVCVENIGPKETRKRLLWGAVLAAAAVAGGVFLVLNEAPRFWRLGLFFPLWAAALAYHQARERTCVTLARRGTRNLDHGIEVVSDPAVVAASRRQARKVTIVATVTAVVATLLLFLIPT